MDSVLKLRDFDPTKFCLINAKATVQEFEVSDEAVLAAIKASLARAGYDMAEPSPIGENRHPRMLQLTAFLCHDGKPNLNDRGFTTEDLKEVVANGMFGPPYMGMIDHNHDFTPYGAWYKTEFRFDPKANANGILGHGAIWAWRFPELADKLLAIQARQGYIDVSMSCLAEFYEPAEWEGQEYLLVRKPVFFTTSTLDVRPADPNGNGVGSEDVEGTPEDRTQQLLHREEAAAHIQEESMDEMLKKFEAILAEHSAEIAPLVDALKSLPALEKEKADLTAKVDELSQSLAGMTAERDALQVSIDALKTEAEAAQKELEELRAFKSETEAAKAEAEKAAKVDARMKQIPEPVVASLEKREDKDALLASWMEMSDPQWALVVETFGLATVKPNLAELSEKEGALSSVVDEGEGKWAITKHINR